MIARDVEHWAEIDRRSDRFLVEAAQAKRLGCALTIRMEPGVLTGGIVYARITPTTPRARHHLTAAATDDGSPGRDTIEVRQTYTGNSRELIDAIAAAISHALAVASHALA